MVYKIFYGHDPSTAEQVEFLMLSSSCNLLTLLNYVIHYYTLYLEKWKGSWLFFGKVTLKTLLNL